MQYFNSGPNKVSGGVNPFSPLFLLRQQPSEIGCFLGKICIMTVQFP